jgi:phage recombination protein Bet
MTTATTTAAPPATAPSETTSTDLVAVHSSPLALRAGQVDWTPDQRAGLDAIGCGNAPAPTARLFLNQCLRTGLDPFLRQIHLVPRPTKNGGQTWTIQVGIDGMRLLADRAAARSREPRGMRPTIWYDDAGKPYEAWVSNKAPAAAKVTVTRGDREFTAVARTAAYAATNRDGQLVALWRTMPDVMIAKCAEALALRMAYPADLSGLYTDDEMAQADGHATNPPQTATTALTAAPAPSETVRVEEHQPPDPQAAYDLALRAMDQTEPDVVRKAKTWADGQDLLDVAVQKSLPAHALEKAGLRDSDEITLGDWLDFVTDWVDSTNGVALSVHQPAPVEQG